MLTDKEGVPFVTHAIPGDAWIAIYAHRRNGVWETITEPVVAFVVSATADDICSAQPVGTNGDMSVCENFLGVDLRAHFDEDAWQFELNAYAHRHSKACDRPFATVGCQP
jgi:hypothetical protein